MKVRQSERLKNIARTRRAEELENGDVNEPINLEESERDDELEIVQIDEIEEPIPCGKSLEEKVDQLVEDVEILKSKVIVHLLFSLTVFSIAGLTHIGNDWLG